MVSERIVREELEEKALVRKYLGSGDQGFFVEVGANEPTSIFSQTWHLEQMGWKGILIEPIPELFSEIVEKRPNSKAYKVACSSPENVGAAELKIPFVSEGRIDTGKASLEVEIDHGGFPGYRKEIVKVVTLDSILEGDNIQKIDFLSIDVEGTELDVLRGFNLEKYRPRLILLEDRLLYLDKHRWLKNKGYKLVKRTGFNDWYIPKNETFGLSTRKEKLRIFKKLYLSLLIRKIKESFKMKNLKPFKKI